MQKKFVDNVVSKIKNDENVLGLAVGGSWITNEIDEFSDVDLVLVTKNKIAPDRKKMTEFAENLGHLLNAFTGEHVGEKRLLVCLYDNPLLHVDIKFITPDEFYNRIENPIVVWERENILSDIIKNTEPKFPYPNYQWIEDRFWIWVHYVTSKLGRGELFEMLDGLNFLNTNVIAPFIQIKNGQLPRGFRRFEKTINVEDILRVKRAQTICDRDDLIKSFEEIISLYKGLREKIFPKEICLQSETEKRSLEYFEEIKNRN